MTVENISGIYAIKIGATTIPVQSVALANGINPIFVGSSGDVESSFAAIMSINPVISFTTSAIAAVLDIITSPWQAKTTALTMYLRRHTHLAARSAGADFQSITCAAGLLIPRAINASQGGVATLSCDYFPVAAAGTAGHVIAEGVANPTLVTLLANQWTVGPASINNSTATAPHATRFKGVQSLSIDFGVQPTPMSGDGEVYPSFISVGTAAPSITISLSDSDALVDLGIEGVAQHATNLSGVYLWKLAEDGTRVAIATATAHISVIVSSGLIICPGIGGSHPAIVSPTIVITPTAKTGVSAQLLVDTTTAIPAEA